MHRVLEAASHNYTWTISALNFLRSSSKDSVKISFQVTEVADV